MLDEQIVALSKAIRQHETGNRPVQGATGELASRYQYLPGTWKATAGKYLGNANAELTEENENKATYLKLKDWKDQGYNPGQIASMWNSGHPDMYRAGNKGVGQSSANPDVQFNVPKYVESVYKLYQGFKPVKKTEYQKELVADLPEEKPKMFEPSPEGVRFRDVVREGFGVGKSVINYFKDKFKEAEGEEKELMRREDEGEINKLAEFVGRAGVGAEVITSTAFDTVVQSIKGLGLLTEKVTGTEFVDEAQAEVVNQAINFFNTESGKSVLEIVEAGEGEWAKFEEANPSLAEIVKGTAKVSELALLGTTKAGRETTEAIVKPAVKAVKETAAVTGEALETTGKKLLTGVEKQIVREAEDIISPKLTGKTKDLALSQGRISDKGVYTLSKFEKEIADVASPFVKKGNTPQKNINNIVSEIKKESESLAKTLKANDAIFNTNQLKANIKEGLKGVDDILIDEKRLAKAKDEIVELLINEVETKKLSSLWEARKNFDNIIDSKLNAFAGVSTIKKDISLAVRQSVNDFIVSKSPQLAKDGKHPFSDAMSKMHRLYSAEKNIASKVLPSQLNQTVLSNLGNKIKSISHKIGAIKGGAAIIGVYSLGQALFNPAVIGAILAYGSYKVGKTVVTSKTLRKAIGTLLEKSGKLLNPAEKKHLQELAATLDKAIKSEAGFAKIPGISSELTANESALVDTFLDNMRAGKEIPKGTQQRIARISEKLDLDESKNLDELASTLDDYMQKAEGAVTKADDITSQISKAKAEDMSFEEWFGKKEKAYHGSYEKIDKFDDGYFGDTTANNEAEVFYFTESEPHAVEYSREAFARRFEGEYYEKYGDDAMDKLYDKAGLNIQTNPSVLDVKNPKIKDWEGESLANRWEESYDFINQAKDEGYDGVIYKNISDDVNPASESVQNEIIVFSKDQIKTKSQLKQLWDKQ